MLRLSTSLLDLGNVETAAVSAPSRLVLQNVGDFPATGVRLNLEAGVFSIAGTDCNRAIPAGSSCFVDITASIPDTVTHTGRLNVALDNGNVMPNSAMLTATGASAASYASGGQNFGPERKGTVRYATGRIESVGQLPLKIESISIAGEGLTLLSHDCPASMDPGTFCELQVRFEYLADDGFTEGRLVIETNGGPLPSQRVRYIGFSALSTPPFAEAEPRYTYVADDGSRGLLSVPVAIRNSHASQQYRIEPRSAGLVLDTSACDKQLAPYEACTVIASFDVSTPEFQFNHRARIVAEDGRQVSEFYIYPAN